MWPTTRAGANKDGACVCLATVLPQYVQYPWRRYRSGLRRRPPPTFTGANAWYLSCGLAGAAVSEQVAIDAVGRPRCFGCLTAFPWAAAQHEVQRASGEMSPAPTPGGRGHPPGGRDL